MGKVYLCIACGIGHTEGVGRFCPQHETGLTPEEKTEILHRYNSDEKVREAHTKWEQEEELRIKEGRIW